MSILENPYKYICNYYESIYPNIGRAVFSVVSLMPVSLIIPPIPSGKKSVKQKINLLLIASPGAGKTSLAEEFEKITYNPVFTEHITSARLNYELRDKDKITLITSDIAHSFANEELVKYLEGVLGDEGAISRETMKNVKDKRKKIDAVAYMSGTFENISNERVRDGLLYRTCPLIITHTFEQHENILDQVNREIGEIKDGEREEIINFYQELKSIQDGEHDNFTPITGYDIPKEFKEELNEFIKPLIRPAFEEYGVNAVRQLQEAYRFMVNHCFLNIHNREVKNGKVVIEQKDLGVAKYLIDREIDTIFHIVDVLSELNRRGIRTYKQLKEWQDRTRKKESRERKFIMEGIVKK